jgi:sugar lactone lactonase YvrE
LLLVLASLMLSASARAQTASFTYAIAALGGGFSDPFGVAVDASGNIYVANYLGNSVMEFPAGCASSSCVITLGGGFSYPAGVAVDASGNVYVANSDNGTVMEMPPGCASSSCVTTLGGGFAELFGVAVDASGHVYVADTYNNAVKEMPAGCASSSCVTALGGGFSGPAGLTVDRAGNVYVADSFHNAVKEMPAGCASSSCVTTLGGGFSYPAGVAVDASGNIFVADDENDAVKEMPAGCASSSCVTVLGTSFGGPQGLAVDGGGNIYVADSQNNAVKEIMTRAVNLLTVPVGTTSTALTLNFTFDSAGSLSSTTPYMVLTGGAQNLDFKAAASQGSSVCNGTTPYTTGETCTLNVTFTPAKAGSRNGAVELFNAGGGTIATTNIFGTGTGPQVVFSPATQSTLGGGFSSPFGVAVDGAGNVYVADWANSVVKEMPAGCATSSCVTTLGGGFRYPQGVAVDGSGDLYIADTYSNTVEEMPAGCTYAVYEDGGCVATVLGGGFSYPEGVAVDGSGNVYVTDSSGVVKEMPPGCASSSCVKEMGGGFSAPAGVAVDGSGNVYVAAVGNVDTYQNSAVTEMPAGCASSSCVTTLGGGFINPYGVAVDASGNVYVTGYGDGAVYEMPAGCASSSCVTALSSGSNRLGGVALDGSGNVYVADYGENAVNELNRATPPSLNLGDVTMGSSSSAFPQNVQVANIGNQPLIFTVPVAGSNPSYPANFPESTAESNLCSSATPLAEGSSCNVWLYFMPTVAGANTGSVVLTDNALNQTNTTQSIALSGTGVKVTQTITFPAITGTHDALISFTLSATASSGLTVSFASTSPTICTVSGTTASLLIPGVCVIKATQAGNADYAAAPPVSVGFAVSKATQTITFPTVTATQYAASTLTLSATASSGLAVTFTAAAASASVCTISGATATLLQQGTCIVQANQAGSTLYAAAPMVQQLIPVHLAPQTISFPVPAGTQYALTPVPLTATTTSGLPITYSSITPLYCTVTGSTAYPIQQGSCFVHAAQAGNNVYSIAPLVTQFFTIHLAPQTITFPAITATQYVLSQVTLSATASSGLAVSFASATPAVCTVSGVTASLLNLGDCVIHATQAGSKTVYSVAPMASQSFIVHSIPQTITFPAITATLAAASTLPLSATASSGLTVAFASTTPTVCTVSGTTASLLTSGTCIVQATQAGNANYSAAAMAQQNLLVHLATQTITFPAIGTQVAGTALLLGATASSGLPVTYTAVTPAICTISDSAQEAILSAAGSCVIHATQAGNATYAIAPLVSKSFTVTAN